MDKKVKQYNKRLDSIYKPQAQQLRQQYEALAPQFAAQEESLKQAKVNAFRDIGDTANRRGMFFSGFQPAEQGRYVGEKFLPAMAEVAQQRQQGQLDLMSALTGLNTDRRSRVMDFRETLRQEAQKRKELEGQRRYEAKQAQKQREFQAQQNAADRALTRGGSSYGGGGGGGPQYSVDQQIRMMLDASIGKDKKVDPNSWAQAAAFAARNGIKFGGSDGFANKYWDYVNEDHWRDYKLGYDQYT